MFEDQTYLFGWLFFGFDRVHSKKSAGYDFAGYDFGIFFGNFAGYDFRLPKIKYLSPMDFSQSESPSLYV